MRQIRFIHISDIHFQQEYDDFAKRLNRLTKIDFTEQFKRSVAYILENYRDIDFFLFTGDLVHEKDVEDYRALEALWQEICGLPVYAVAGNHDLDDIGQIFFGAEAEPPFDYTCKHGALRIIGMDSRGGKYGTGLIEAGQLEWLRKQLDSEENSGPAILLLHHTPHTSGEEDFLLWQMENPEELEDVVKDSDIIGIFCGHAHTTFTSKLSGIPCFTVNSVTHGINSGEEAMTLSNQTGFNYCVFEGDRLTVEHVDIPQENHVELVIHYSEFGEAEEC